MGEAESGWQRLDRFLFHARFCRTRALADALVAAGGVRINRQPAEKAHARVRVGDVLTLALPRGVLVAEILALAPRREGAARAQQLYREIAAD